MPENIWTPAPQAVENEDAEALAQLLAKGVDPDEVCGKAVATAQPSLFCRSVRPAPVRMWRSLARARTERAAS